MDNLHINSNTAIDYINKLRISKNPKDIKNIHIHTSIEDNIMNEIYTNKKRARKHIWILLSKSYWYGVAHDMEFIYDYYCGYTMNKSNIELVINQIDGNIKVWINGKNISTYINNIIDCDMGSSVCNYIENGRSLSSIWFSSIM